MKTESPSITHTQTGTVICSRLQKRELTDKTVVSLFCQNSTYVTDAADGELVIVVLVP